MPSHCPLSSICCNSLVRQHHQQRLFSRLYSSYGAGSIDHFAPQTFKFPSTLVIRLYPFGFLMLVYLSETDLLPVALVLFWLLPYLLNLNHLASTPHLQQVQHARSHGQVRRAHELNVNKRELHLIGSIVKTLGLDTAQEFMHKLKKLKKLHVTPSFLVWEDQSIPLTICII